MTATIHIGSRAVGLDHPVYCIAEISANHNSRYENAVELIHAAKASGADAVKLQTYTADTLTINSDARWFQIQRGTLWEGETLYSLYSKAYTPWDWQPKLKAIADGLGLQLFSTPFDHSSVEMLEQMDVPAYKIASYELVDHGLLQRVARTGKPVILSTGMATLAEVAEAVQVLRGAGTTELALLKCTSAYPALPADMNLRTISHMAEAFDCPTGLSDHTLGIAVPVAAVAVGACVVEKHLTLSRSDPGPDSAFSLEPAEFRAMVDAVHAAHQALGAVTYAVTEHEAPFRLFRRSLFVVCPVKAGDLFSAANVRSIRPGHGLPPKYIDAVCGRRAATDIAAGTPLDWSLIV